MSSLLSEIFEQSSPYSEMQMETRQQRTTRPPASRPRPAVAGKNPTRIPPGRQMAMAHQPASDKEPQTQRYPPGFDPNNPQDSVPTVRYPKWFDPKDYTDFGSISEPKKEVAVLQEIFQESESEWVNNYGYDYGYGEQESESGNDWIPPTLRSPGVPPPPPSTRREGRGQQSLPPVDSEPPTVRLPRKVQPFRPSSNAPIQKNGPRPSIRRELEVPLMEEIFMEAEVETNDREFLFEDYATMEYMVAPNKRPKTKNKSKRERINQNQDDGPVSDKPILPPDHRDAGRGRGLKIDATRIFRDILVSKLRKANYNERNVENWVKSYSLTLQGHTDENGHTHKNYNEALSSANAYLNDNWKDIIKNKNKN